MAIFSPTIPASKSMRSGGAPGVHSARYAGDHATDAANNALLLESLRGIENRSARFVCVIALVRDGKLVKTFRGTVEGHIIDEPRGDGGFGYDPLFYCPAFGCTFGEASHRTKDASEPPRPCTRRDVHLPAKYRFHLRNPTLVFASLIFAGANHLIEIRRCKPTRRDAFVLHRLRLACR